MKRTLVLMRVKNAGGEHNFDTFLLKKQFLCRNKSTHHTLELLFVQRICNGMFLNDGGQTQRKISWRRSIC